MAESLKRIVGVSLSWPQRILAWPLRMIVIPWHMVTRMTPGGAIFAALAVMCGICSLGPNSWSNIPLLIALTLMALWVLAYWQGWRVLKDISFRRRHAEHVFSGDTLTVTVYLTNLSKLPASGLFVEEDMTEVVPNAPDAGARKQAAAVAAHGRAFVMVLGGKETGRATYSVALRRRGLYAFSTSRLETVYPLGFFRSSSPRRSPGRLIVYPRLGEVNTALFEDVERTLDAMRRARPSRAEEEFRGLREYRREDNPRWIHWRGSARAGELLVREFEEPISKRVLLLLDTNLRGLGPRRFAAFENAVSFVATVVREFARRGIEVECVALQPNGQTARTIVSRARRNLDALLEMLAMLRRDDTRALDALLDVLPRRSVRGTFVLVCGLGSMRVENALRWLRAGDNAVRILDARGEEFARIFRRDAGGSTIERAADEDMLMSLGDDEFESDVA